jgi:hypothetical protein
MGSLYNRGNVWRAKSYVDDSGDGRRARESTGAAKRAEPHRFLSEPEGRAATGQPILRRADRILYEEIATVLWRPYRTTGARDDESH